VKEWPQLPDEKFKQILLDWEPRGEKGIPYFPTPDMCCEIVDWMEMLHNIDDALGICAAWPPSASNPPTTSTTIPSWFRRPRDGRRPHGAQAQGQPEPQPPTAPSTTAGA